MSHSKPMPAVEQQPKNVFGFWVYLMTDCVLFATLFATYAVMHRNIHDGPAGRDIFDINFVLVETLILLTSSFTCGMAMLAARRADRKAVLGWFTATFLLGLSFLGMELYEFNHLLNEGYGWQRSGFLSAFFTLVGTHGLHITIGLLWIGIMMGRVWRGGLGASNLGKLTMLSLFWHFLDIIWIFIFTFVYLMGVR